MKRGEIRWYRFAPPDKRRPVLILTRDSILPKLTHATIAPISSTVRDIPTEAPLDESFGMRGDCAISLDHLQTVAKNKIGPLIARLPPDKMQEVFDALQFALGFNQDR